MNKCQCCRKCCKTEEEQETYNKMHDPKLAPKEHANLMKKMGITDEEHEKWHKEHGNKSK